MSNQLTAQQWGMCIGQKAVANDGVSGIIEGYRCGYVFLKYTQFNRGRFYKTSEIKPILRTDDQMTEKEKAEFSSLFLNKKRLSLFFIGENYIACYILVDDNDEYPCNTLMTDWLTAKGFDIRGWIEQGLAIKQEANNG